MLQAKLETTGRGQRLAGPTVSFRCLETWGSGKTGTIDAATTAQRQRAGQAAERPPGRLQAARPPDLGRNERR